MLTGGMLLKAQVCAASREMHPRESASLCVSLLGLPELFVPLRDTPTLWRTIPAFMCAWQDYINCL